MRTRFIRKPSSATALAALGAFFLAGLVYDLRSLEDELGYQHRLMACLGLYELKANLSNESPRALCERAVIGPLAADFE